MQSRDPRWVGGWAGSVVVVWQSGEPGKVRGQ